MLVLDSARLLYSSDAMHTLLSCSKGSREVVKLTEGLSFLEGECSHTDLVEVSEKSNSTLMFEGYIFLKDQIIVDEEIFHEYQSGQRVADLAACEGAFKSFLLRGFKLRALTDLFGHEPFFYFLDEDIFAVSDSFFLLVKFLRSCGHDLSFDREVLRLQLSPEDFADTLITVNTLVENLKILAPARYLQFDIHRFELFIDNARIPEIQPNLKYEEVLKKSVSKISSRIVALSGCFSDTVLSLSAGLDSRITYAISNRLAEVGCSYFTNPRSSEKEIVEKLLRARSDKLLTEFPRRAAKSLSPEQALRRWDYSNLGVYYFLDVNQAIRAKEQSFLEIRGGGGEILRGYYGDAESALDPSDEPMRLQRLACLRSQETSFQEQLKRLGWRSLHYLNFKSRIHFGRISSETSRFAARYDPMNCFDLFIAASMIDEKERRQGRLHCDLILMNQPELVFYPFDLAEKEFSSETLRASPFLGNLPDIQFSELVVRRPTQSPKTSASKEWREEQDFPWLSLDEFIALIDEMLILALESHLPSELRNTKFFNAKRNYLERSAKSSYNTAGRQISKFYSVSRLTELGVTL